MKKVFLIILCTTLSLGAMVSTYEKKYEKLPPQDQYKTALELLQKAKDNPNYIWLVSELEDPARACIKTACFAGYVPAILDRLNLKGVLPLLGEEITYLESLGETCALGDSRVQYALALLHLGADKPDIAKVLEKGHLTIDNATRMLDALEKSAQANYKPAVKLLLTIYLKGRFVLKNPEKEQELMHKLVTGNSNA